VTALVLAFGIALLVAVLLSGAASRSPLSTSAVFLATGIVAGPLVLGAVSISHPGVETAAEVALFAILFTDGQHAPLRVLREHIGPPSRALVLAMPLTFAIVTVLAHLLLGLDWAPAAVLGAVLAPTDPVFASALVGREDVPARVRHLLNIESGVNDGLALPVVLVLVGTAGGMPQGWSTEPLVLLLEVVLGVALGVGLPVTVHLLLRLPGVAARPQLQALGPLGLAVLLFGLCTLLHANPFLAAFAAGSTIATLRPEASESFRHTGELASELVKGGALIAFGSLLEPALLDDVTLGALVLAVLTVAVARPVPALLSLVGTDLVRRERWAVAWFGPKGFASVAYAVVASASGMVGATEVLAVATVTVLLSVVVHSSTDVAVARALRAD
jgi:sodium/hydrogen antiporter